MRGDLRNKLRLIKSILQGRPTVAYCDIRSDSEVTFWHPLGYQLVVDTKFDCGPPGK